MVFARGTSTWEGHVGFFVTSKFINGKEYYVVLGGNQSNQIGYDTYPKSRLLGIRRL